MKVLIKISSLQVFFLFGILLVSFINPNDRHIGTWEGTDDSAQSGQMILDKTNHCVFIIGEEKLGGEEFEIDGIKAECRYEIDYSKTPVWLDIIFISKADKVEKGRLKAIIRFISDDKMEMRMNPESNERYTKFDASDKENSMMFKRVKGN
ncbi:MAG: hypothetical protein ACHQIM_20605 [Sphingobacteriales bacterium]